MQRVDFLGALRALRSGEVEFIVVGGLAALLNGAPVNTFDLDIVHSRERSNIARLLAVLESLDATFRIEPERRLRPGLNHLTSPGHLNLQTKCGPVDVLGTIGQALSYEDLLNDTVELNIGDGVSVRVLKLEKLIELKEQLGGEKDRAVLPILRRTLELKKL
jgi:hypothetical protein